ncbi:MAG: type II toxin-antitoxin system HicA family toxin [Clostridia bacterium]|nr:type II toxin-antitoxin system HicA family toxin [Clostridia bacterium]MDH7573182.1 type II toxin-antitoxin system HicA family toxin [Clostridia bacterium]
MPPRFRELKAYCEKNGWVLIRQTDHYYYDEKVLADGTVLRTRVSMALHKEIPRQLWKRILSRQLRVTEEEFWRGLH